MGTIMRVCDRAASEAAQEKRRRTQLVLQTRAAAQALPPEQLRDGLQRRLRAAERALGGPLGDMNGREERVRSIAGQLGYVSVQLAAEQVRSAQLQGQVQKQARKMESIKYRAEREFADLMDKKKEAESARSERDERRQRLQDEQYLQLADAELQASTELNGLRTELHDMQRRLEEELAERVREHQGELEAIKKERDEAVQAEEAARSRASSLQKMVSGFKSGSSRRAHLQTAKVNTETPTTTASGRRSQPAQVPTPIESDESRRRFASSEIRRLAAGLSSRQLAKALGTDTIRTVLRSKEAEPVCMEFARGLKRSLEAVWDSDLAIELKCVGGISDAQMDELRRCFSLVTGAKRATPRIWYKTESGKGKVADSTVHFPSPIPPRSEWFKKWETLCAKHNILSSANGQVSERSFGDVFDLVINRNLKMAHEGAGLTADFPLDGPIGSADAVSWGHKLKVTHGGLKFADFAPGYSAHSEWNYVTAMVGRMDDGHASQEKLCGQFAADFGEAMKRGYRDVNGVGRVYFKGGMCTDMAFTRAAIGRRAMSSPHCECGKDKDTRAFALHEPYTLPRSASYDDIMEAVKARCTLLTMRRSFELTHRSPPDHDWSTPLRCSACPPEEDGSKHIIFRTKEEEVAEVARLAALQCRADAGDVAAKKALKKELDTFATLHCQFGKYKRPLLWLGIDGSMISWRQDVMHGINLNMAKCDFKYSWLDGATGVPSCGAASPRLRPCACMGRVSTHGVPID